MKRLQMFFLELVILIGLKLFVSWGFEIDNKVFFILEIIIAQL